VRLRWVVVSSAVASPDQPPHPIALVGDKDQPLDACPLLPPGRTALVATSGRCRRPLPPRQHRRLTKLAGCLGSGPRSHSPRSLGRRMGDGPVALRRGARPPHRRGARHRLAAASSGCPIPCRLRSTANTYPHHIPRPRPRVVTAHGRTPAPSGIRGLVAFQNGCSLR
jgi:hypothetical protein